MLYEILYIVPSRFSDTEITEVQGRVNDILVKNEATVKSSINLGKLKFAYPIKKERHGTYVLTYMEVEGANLAKIDQDLRLADDVLRHVIVKREAMPSAPVTLTAYQSPLTPEGKRAEKRTVRDAAPAPVVSKPAAEQLSTEEIDKKLDEILEDDIVE